MIYMNYEIISLEEMNAVGITARTKNSDANMTSVIGELWRRFYGEGIYVSITSKSNHKALGIYSDYESDVNSEYSITVACQVDNTKSVPEGTIVRNIPEGKYAKFVVKGHMQKAVAEFWEELWKMDLDRSYACDFEEYQNDDMENAEIHVYISLK